MPYTFSIDPARNLIWERYSGTVTIDDLRNCSRGEWAHPAFRKGMHILSDFRGTEFALTADEMRVYATLLGEGEEIGRQAIVVSTTLGRGLARMFELTAETGTTAWSSMKIFTDIAAAELWLVALT
jgi:hypothetical protein